MLRDLHPNTHPMTQLCQAVLALQVSCGSITVCLCSWSRACNVHASRVLATVPGGAGTAGSCPAHRMLPLTSKQSPHPPLHRWRASLRPTSHSQYRPTAASSVKLTLRTAAAQVESKFAADYRAGIHKSKYWEPVFEDSINLIAKLPTIAAAIYRWAAGAGWAGWWGTVCAGLAGMTAGHCLLLTGPSCLCSIVQQHLQGRQADRGGPQPGLGRQPVPHDGWVLVL